MRNIVGPNMGPDMPLTTAMTEIADVFPPRFSVESCASASVTLLGATARLIVADMPSDKQRGGYPNRDGMVRNVTGRKMEAK